MLELASRAYTLHSLFTKLTAEFLLVQEIGFEPMRLRLPSYQGGPLTTWVLLHLFFIFYNSIILQFLPEIKFL